MRTFTETAHQGETLDALIYRALGAGSGIFEQVLNLNRGIADIGPVLPEGLPVILPVPSTATPERKIAQLWE